MEILFTAVFVGILVGLISSILGLGGGIILVPALNLVFHLPQNEAIATSLATIGLITLLNTIRFSQRNEIDWTMVLVILIFSAFSSIGGGYLVTVLSEKILLMIFIVFLCYVLFQMVFSHRLKRSVRKKSYWFWASSIGLSSGLISGTTGVGGGVIITPLLFKSGIVKARQVVPITNAVMFFNALFALIPLALSHAAQHSFWGLGYIHFDRALLIFTGAIPASIFGTKYQSKISVKVKKISIGFILLIILFKMILRLF